MKRKRLFVDAAASVKRTRCRRARRRLMAALAATMLLTASFALPLWRDAQAASVLQVGSTGADVTKVQKRLIQYGYMTGSADGVYGEKTRAAVVWFQQRNGLTVDGKVGPGTAAALGVTLSGASSSASSQYLLAKLIYAEARGEVYKGKVAVGAVVLNRVRSSSFPNTISGVIYQSAAFDCVSNGSINNSPNSECLRAAQEALNGWDPTGGCLYFYNAKTVSSSSWIHSRTVKTVIGNHSFAV